MILAVCGGKGGVGKSTLAYNLGAVLDTAETATVVVDADLGMANLPFTRGPDLHDVLAGRACPLEAVSEGHVRLLPCGRSLAGARAADLSRLTRVLRDVEREFGTVVIDCPAGMRADAGVPLAVADVCLLVVSPDPFAVGDAVRTRELARELDCGLVGVALNRGSPDPGLCTQYERLFGAPVTPIPTDPALGRSIQQGRPVTDRTASPETVDALERVASAVRSVERV